MLANTPVKIFEMGPRDGLQNESTIISVDTKLELIKRLVDCGLKYIEAASFVSPKWVPQMADAAQIMDGITEQGDVVYSALVPNLRGFENALKSNVKEVAIFAAASEAFSQKNTNCSIQQSLDRFVDIMALAKAENLRVRGYVSTVLGCPYQGNVDSADVVSITKALYEMGCYEVSLGDTIGVGTADKVTDLIEACAAQVPVDKLAVHFHDSYGQALTNIYAALQSGVRIIDSSVAGLGGCPYAKGATGNVATEDVVYLLNGLGLESGIDLDKLCDVGQWITGVIGKANSSKAGLALSIAKNNNQ